MIFVRARAVKNPNPSQAAALPHARAVQDGPSRPLSGSLIYHEMLPVMLMSLHTHGLRFRESSSGTCLCS